jgi:hypothetical protein
MCYYLYNTNNKPGTGAGKGGEMKANVNAYSTDTNSSRPVFIDQSKAFTTGAGIFQADLSETFTLERCRQIAKEAARLDSRKITNITIEDYAKKKTYTYSIANNRLTIFKDGVPVYENWNGTISRDQDALADDIL